MSVPLLSDLREPPVVGKFYMVPVIRDYPYLGKVGTWPVIGAKHSDVDFFSLKTEHYHVDARFLTAAQEDAINHGYRTTIAAVGAHPLGVHDHPLPKGRPDLARRKCRRATYGNAHTDKKQIVALNAHYGAPADPIWLADGRMLCPHRKADLSQFEADADGIVVCPLHGLRVRCATLPTAKEAG